MISSTQKREDIIELFAKIVANFTANEHFNDILIHIFISSKSTLLNDLFIFSSK
jgi:hypothetical protein